MPLFLFKRKKYRERPFSRLPLKRRAIFILWIAGFTYRELSDLKMGSQRTTARAIKQAQEENYLK